MRTAEDSSGTVLHRLIQEQLRYGNLTDTRTLLAIQQQALRGGSSSSSSSGGGGSSSSPRSSLESLTQEESQYIQMSTRQEPQGQEYQGDRPPSESPVCRLYQLHGEELPTYEEAKAHSQYLISQQEKDAMVGGHQGGESPWDLKREHARSLSERLMQLSLERSALTNNLGTSFSNSYPQLYSNGATAPERHGATDQRGPPPDYPFCASLPGYVLSHSREHGQFYRDPPPPPPFYAHHSRFVSAQSQAGRGGPAAFGHGSAEAGALMRENERLRKELEVYVEKAARLQKLESEIQRISEAYETLMKGSAKRETLEKTMRNKLEAEIKRMHDFNRDLREQLDAATKRRAAREAESLDQKQQVFVKLLEQKEEQQRERERLELQVQRLRISMDECRRGRELTEQGLASAQSRNRQLEEELQRKRAYVEKVERLQSALAQLQAACEKREVLELRLRTRLEQELRSLRAQQSQKQGCEPSASEPSSSTQQQQQQQQQLREKEERILALEADITKWEQKYLEESTMRQFAMDAAATAAAQRDTTIIKHSPGHSPNNSFNEDLPLSSHRHKEMENRIRALHAQLLEKDAVIKVIQQRSRWEQGRGLRPARSVPSISTVSAGTDTKGKSLSDDLTAAAAPQPRACATARGPSRDARGPSRDSSTQSDQALREPERLKAERGATSAAPTDASEEPKASPETFKSVNGSDADVVEILI